MSLDVTWCHLHGTRWGFATFRIDIPSVTLLQSLRTLVLEAGFRWSPVRLLKPARESEKKQSHVSIDCHQFLCLIIVGCIAMVWHFEIMLHWVLFVWWSHCLGKSWRVAEGCPINLQSPSKGFILKLHLSSSIDQEESAHGLSLAENHPQEPCRKKDPHYRKIA